MTLPAAPSGYERLDTARLVLRRPLAADVDGMFQAYASDAAATRYLSWPRHHALDQTRAFVDFSDDEWGRWPAGPLLIEERATGRVIGGTGLAFETPWRASTGYVLARETWGRGYATEALAAMVSVAGRTGVVRLYALCHVEHQASRRVLERGGFTCEGLLRRHLVFPNLGPTPCDTWSYARILV
jgi:RimJ/RimL family protein N-acetyltransferase